jgi:hypothetical protein
MAFRALSGNGLLPRLERPPLPFFYNQCMGPASPAVLLGVIDAWPAMGSRRWSLDYLLDVAGHRTVPVEIGQNYLSDDFDEQLMSLGSFIRRCIAPNAGVAGMAGNRSGGGWDVRCDEFDGETGMEARGGAGGAAGGEPYGSGGPAERGSKLAPRRWSGAGGGWKEEAESCMRSRQLGVSTAVASAGPHELVEGPSSTVAESSCRVDTAGSSARGSECGWSAHGAGASQPAWGYLAQHQLFEQLPLLRRDIAIPEYCSLTLEEEEDRCA